MRRAIFVLLLLASLFLAILAWMGEVTFVAPGKARIENLLARALAVPVRFSTLTLSLVTTSLRVTDLHVGDRGVAEVADLRIQLLPLASLREGRPVVVVHVVAPMIDLTQLPDDEEEEEEDPTAAAADPFASIPPLRVSELEISDLQLRFPMGEDPVDVTAVAVRAAVQRPVLRHVLEGNIDLQTAEWHRKGFSFRVDMLSAAGGADAEGVWLENAAADGPDLSLRSNATTEPHHQQVLATLDPSLLGAFVDDLAQIGGHARIEGTLSGNIIDPITDVQLELKDGSFAGRPIGDLATRFTRRRSRLAFEDIQLRGEVGRARGAVQLVAFDEVPIQADLQWEDVDLPGLLHVLDADVPFHLRIDGQTLLSGTIDPLDLKIRGNGRLRPDAVPAGTTPADTTWTATTRVLSHRFEARAELTQPGNSVDAELSIDGEDFRGHLEAGFADLSPLAALLPDPIPAFEMAGRGSTRIDLGGTTEHPTVRGELRLEQASMGGTAVDELQGTVRMAAGVLHGEEVRLRAGTGEAVLQGAIALDNVARNDWSLTLHDVATDLLTEITARAAGVELPLRAGTIRGTVRGQGAWETARLEGELAARDLSVLDEPFASANANFDLPLPAWQAQLELVHVGGGHLRASGRGRNLTETSLSFDSDAWALAKIRRLDRPDLRGSVSLHGEVSGPWARTSGQMQVAIAGLGDRLRTVGDLRIDGRGQDGHWQLTTAVLDDRLDVQATLRTSAPFAYTLAVRAADADLTPWVFGRESSHLSLRGEMNLGGDLANLDAARGSLRIEELRLTRDVRVVQQAEPIVIELDRGRVMVRSLALQSSDGRLQLGGEWALVGEARFEARGEGDLALLEMFELPIAAARGPFSLRVAARYAPATGWRFDGEGQIRDAIVDLGLPIAFTRTTASFRLVDDTIFIDQIEGRAGGGQFAVHGSLDLQRGPQIEWNAREVGFSPFENVEVRLSGRGKFDGTWEEPALSGGIEVLNALYDRNFDWADLLPWLLEQLSGRSMARVQVIDTPISLRLVIYSRGGVYVDNNLANLEAWVDLLITGDTRLPVISGRIGFLDGEVFLRGRKFTITGGMVDFRDYYRNDPLINIMAEGRVVSPETDYGLTIIVSGSASRPRVQFSASDPTLSQADVFNLATFGKTSAQLQREGSGVSAADALALVPTGEIEKRVGALVGFDRFEVEAVQSRNTGAIEPRVTIGKDLTDSLRALVWTSFGVEARRAVQLEYRVSRRISLLGAWESDTRSEAGVFGGDVKFRYEFRRVRFSLLKEIPFL